jgi:hypothetical protein
MKFLLCFIFLFVGVFAQGADHWGSTSNAGVGSATGTSTKLMSANFYRQYLMIQNNGSASISIKFGAVQSATEGILIPAGGNWEMIKPTTESIYVIAVTGTQAFYYVEGQ